MRPYIYVKTSESRPTCSITIYAFVNLGKFRYVFLPYQILQNSDEFQKMKVGEIIRKHFLESDGKCPGMGSITDYFYRNSYDSFWEFDTEGDFVNSSIGNFFESHALAMYNNKTIAETPVSSIIYDKFIEDCYLKPFYIVQIHMIWKRAYLTQWENW